MAIEHLYPDVAQIGGLLPALYQIFHELSVDINPVKVDGIVSPWWAFIHEGPRSSKVVTALYERKFNIDFWYQGVLYGSGWTSDLREVALAAVVFYREKAAINEMATRFLWLTPHHQAYSHERGAESFV